MQFSSDQVASHKRGGKITVLVSVADMLEILGAPVPIGAVMQMALKVDKNLNKLEVDNESQQEKKDRMLESLRDILNCNTENVCSKQEANLEPSENESEFDWSSMDEGTSGGDKSDRSKSSSQDDGADHIHGRMTTAARRNLWPEPKEEDQTSVSRTMRAGPRVFPYNDVLKL